MRQQLINFTSPLRRQARKDILQIRVRIMAIEPRRLDQTHNRRRPLAAAQRPCKEPVLAFKSPRPNLVLCAIIVNVWALVVVTFVSSGCEPPIPVIVSHCADGCEPPEIATRRMPNILRRPQKTEGALPLL